MQPGRTSRILPAILTSFAIAALAGHALARSVEKAETAKAGTAGDVAARASAIDALIACTPLERQMLDDASDGRFGRFSLFEAALIAGGADSDETLARYQRLLAGKVCDLRRSGAVRGTIREKAQAVFECLHREVLTGGYSLDCTDVRKTLDTGRFNCVSATVLFNCMAAQFGLAVSGLESPGHAMSRLELPEGPLDIETTCRGWFRLADSKPGRKVRVVSEVELVAMIYYNRGVDLLAAKQFADAASANGKSLRLAPANATARGNLLATLNNWAIDLGRAGRFDEAAGILRMGLDFDPHYAAFSVNYAQLYRHWSLTPRQP